MPIIFNLRYQTNKQYYYETYASNKKKRKLIRIRDCFFMPNETILLGLIFALEIPTGENLITKVLFFAVEHKKQVCSATIESNLLQT